MKIVIDTREQKPYGFSVPTIKKKLEAGDYSIEGFENRIAVERKSKEDFILTIIHNRSRFYEELKKLKTYDISCIVVECSYRDLATGIFEGNASVNSVIGTIHTIIVGFRIPIYFLNDRPSCMSFIESMFKRINKKYNGE